MLKLAQLINLEVQLIKDSEADPVLVRHRDRAIGQKLTGKNVARPQLFLQWLDHLENPDALLPGKIYTDSLRIVRYILFFFGLAAGLSAGSAVLHFDGSQPVNVVNFLAVLLGLQLFTYFLFLLNCLPVKVKSMLPFVGDFYNFIRDLSVLIAKNSGHLFGKFTNKKAQSFFENLHRVRMRQQLYRNIEKWLLIRLTQSFSIAFNTGALFICIYLIVFSDLAFAWNTTLDLRNETFHQLVELFSRPWHALIPEAVPSLELIEKTRFFRLEGEYFITSGSQRTADVFVRGGWWPFLITSLAVYGLLPRLLLAGFAKWRFYRNVQRAPFDTADFSALYERLTTPVVETRSEENSIPPISSQKQNDKISYAEFNPGGESCILVLWGELAISEDMLRSTVLQRFGWQPAQIYEAGLMDINSDTSTIHKIREIENQNIPILLLVESWETPNKAVKYFLKNLRQYITTQRAIIIGLVDTVSFKSVSRSDWNTWQKELSQLADPYLRVAEMVEDNA
ncbi:MAG: DUF2868 domain-containing protein [Deferribacteres bacterium]|nr:DUF2868 domain-containing protein [candidate division KSB1 bacterium]MCB9504324.1 DUF2868 domain-containing protein [Deferribacteres bacterium]